jgi:topoisomerase IA-like protein
LKINSKKILIKYCTRKRKEFCRKARWGSVITKGKIKIELSKDVDATKLTLEEVQEMIAKKHL